MTDLTRVRIGRAMAAMATSCAIIGIAWLLALGYRQILWDDWMVHNAIVALGCSVIVWLVIPAQPTNGAIWVLAWAALFSGVEVFAYAISAQWVSNLGIDEALLFLVPSDLPLGLALILMQLNWLWMGVLLTLLVLALFPDGKPASPRWRWLPTTMIAVIGLTIFGLFWGARPTSVVPLIDVQDTHGGFSSITSSLVTVGYPLTFAFGLLSVVGLVGRYRRSVGEERQQFRWVTWGASVFGAFMMAALLFDEVAGRVDVSLYLGAIALSALIGSIGMAIAKYRLYDVDVVISRTLVLGVLAGFITLTYAVVVVGVGELIGGDSGDLFLPIAATAVVAVAFEPVRLRAQRWANRLVFGSRATPYEVLSDLTERLGTAEAGEELLDRLAELLRSGTGADEALVWLGEPGAMRVAAVSPIGAPRADQPDLDNDTSFLVSHDGEAVGALEVRKARGSALSPQERSLVSDLAGSAGAVLGYQRLNDSLQTKAIELEKSRARLVGAQDDERRRLERELHEGAEQYIVALKVKLGVARQLAARRDATQLANLLEGLTGEAQAALEEVQSLAKGIYPPILESDGLGAAISALASSAPVDIRFDRDGIGRYSTDIEAAVYFDVSEAITNAVKHADGPIQVQLTERSGRLSFTVADEGPGFDIDDLEKGSGLENMADRLSAVGGTLTIDSSTGSSTRVHGEVPV